ncbi:transforming growth factor beta-1-induced transcript 1 protein isoform X7 [Buteo buteo]|uniref:transforming growth factor beta-1-induced transcript 1 protein isoform X7 n=1 Tax=Buteo buteo TaxID=30397 RepID=UPI003EBA87B9
MGCLGVFEVPRGCGAPHRGPTDTSRPTQERPTGAPLCGMRHRGGLQGAPWGAWGSSRCPIGVGCPTEVQRTPRDPHKNIPLAPHCWGHTVEVVFKVPRGVLGGLRGAPWVWGAPRRSNGHPATPTRTSHWRPVAWDAPSRWSSRCPVGCLGVFEVPHGCGVPHRGPTDTSQPTQERPTGAPLRGMSHRGGLRGAPWGAWGSSRCSVGCLGVFEVPHGCGVPHRGPTDTPRPPQEHPTGTPLRGMRHRGGLRGAPWGAWGSSKCPVGYLGVFEVPRGCGVPHRGPTDTPRPPQEHPTGTPLRGMRHRGGLRGAPWGAWGSSKCPVGYLGVFEVPRGCGAPHGGPTDTPRPPQEHSTGEPLDGAHHRVGHEGFLGGLGGLHARDPRRGIV